MLTQRIHSSIGPRQVAPMSLTPHQLATLAKNPGPLRKIGINVHQGRMRQMASYAMDADITPTLTTPSISTPISFLQEWLSGTVDVVTAARVIDELAGVVTQASWAHEEVVQKIQEMTGEAAEYGDYTNSPQASWNTNQERRTIARGDLAAQIGILEEARAGMFDISDAESKRRAVAESLEIRRNRIGFYGYNNGANRTYGILNDPNLPAYVSLPDGAGGTSNWSDKTFLEIQSDLLTAYSELRTQSQNRIDPQRTPITLAVASNAVDQLTKTPDYGNSVQEWINKNYPNTRIVSVPEFDDAAGGLGVFYMYAENVDNSGSDGGQTIVQIVPSRMYTLNVVQTEKGYSEGYSNATAGVMVKRPYAVVRYSGVSNDVL